MNWKILIIFILFAFGCKNNREHIEKIEIVKDTTINTKQSVPDSKSKNIFYSLFGIDSIAEADYVFIEDSIDSISMSNLKFNAIYIRCFKGGIHNKNFN